VAANTDAGSADENDSGFMGAGLLPNAMAGALRVRWR